MPGFHPLRSPDPGAGLDDLRSRNHRSSLRPSGVEGQWFDVVERSKAATLETS